MTFVKICGIRTAGAELASRLGSPPWASFYGGHPLVTPDAAISSGRSPTGM